MCALAHDSSQEQDLTESMFFADFQVLGFSGAPSVVSAMLEQPHFTFTDTL
jgi:hypothetical protein